VTGASWPEPPGWPERPDYPYPPLQPEPRRTGPVMVPIVDFPSGDLEDRLFRRRRVRVSGPLDAETANRVSVELMALDGRSGDNVELYINSDGGPLADVLTVLDVVGLMRARVRTVCIGRAKGTAAVLLACGTGGRRAAPHAMISLRCSHTERIEGPPEQLRRRLDDLELVRHHVVAALVSATGQPAASLIDQLDHGPLLDSQQAKQVGLIDDVDTG